MNHHKILNQFLVDVFNDILKAEEDFVNSHFKDLSVKEVHVIEAVYLVEKRGDETRTAEVAKQLKVTAGTLSTAVSALERKGYLMRCRLVEDRRVVLVQMTAKARAVQKCHMQFHEAMVDHLLETINEEEADNLAKSLGSISTFFKTNWQEERK